MPMPAADTPYQLILSQGLPDDAGAARLRDDLPASELHWITRLRRTDDRLRSLTGRALVRRLLGRHLGQAPAAVRLGAGPQGKPMMEDAASGWQFNIAHSGDLVLVGVGPGPVGVDVEHCSAPVDAALWQQVTGRALPEPASGHTAQAFCAQWVRREAVLKACGAGLHIAPAALQLGDGDPGAWQPVAGPAAVNGLRVRLLWSTPAHGAALCLPQAAAGADAWSMQTVALADWI